jgi:hypothetical protein
MNFGLPERRSEERFPTELQGWIASRVTSAAIPCTVWDLSETGLRLVIAEPADVPVEFELHIPSQAARAKVRLIWTTGVHYGAAFQD